jgi:hypothetical protein
MSRAYRRAAVVLAFFVIPIAGAEAATPKPDLVVSSITQPPATATPGTSFAATDRTRNRGKASAGASTTRYFLSLDAKVGKGDMRLGEHSVPRLKPGKSSSRRATMKVPTFAHAGTYRVIACADRKSNVKESNERNNCASARRRMNVVRTSLLGPGTPGGDGPALTIAPGDQAFGAAVGLSDGPVKFTVTNSGKSASGTLGTEVTGTDASMFKVSSDTCAGKTLATGASCTLGVTFSPTSLGAKTASVQVSGAPGGVAAANLTGTGQTAASLGISPADQAFPSTATGSSSSAVVFTVSNNGQAVSGTVAAALAGTDAAHFSISQNNCAGVTLGAGASCTVHVTFSPTGTGGKSASLQVSGSPGGTTSAALTGTGLTPAQLIVDPAARDYGAQSSGSQGGTFPFTVTNTGQATSGVPSITIAGTDASQFVISNNMCAGTTLGGGASCTLMITFMPTGSPGPRSASLQVSATPGTPSGSPATSALTGSATAPLLSISPLSQAFVATNVGSTDPASFTVTYSPSALSPSGPLATSLTGTNADQFAISSNTCAGTVLDNDPATANTNTCTLTVTFAPTSAGSKAATLQVSGTPGGTATSSLSGTGVALGPAVLTMTPETQSFGSQPDGTTGATFAFTVTNTGQSTSSTIAVTKTGTNQADFVIGTNTCQGATLLPNGTCTINVTFMPPSMSLGARSATLQVTATQGGTDTSTMTGTAT